MVLVGDRTPRLVWSCLTRGASGAITYIAPIRRSSSVPVVTPLWSVVRAPGAGTHEAVPFHRKTGAGTASDIDETGDIDVGHRKHSAAGIPAVSVALKRSVEAMGVVRTARTLLRLNQVDGFDCQGCAWPDPDPDHRHTAEFCENGAKAVAEEATTRPRRAGVLRRAQRRRPATSTADYWLGPAGPDHRSRWCAARGATPLRADRLGRRVRADRRARCTGSTARTRRSSTPPARPPTRRRSSTSSSPARFGTNNLPDCSNMCHESTSRGARRDDRHRQGLGAASRTSTTAELIVIAGQNPGTNHPRMLTRAGDRQAATAPRSSRSTRCREAGLMRFKNPQTAARPGRASAPGWPTCTCRSGSTATSRSSRRSAPLLLAEDARTGTSSTTTSSRGTPRGFEEYAAARARPRLGRGAERPPA